MTTLELIDVSYREQIRSLQERVQALETDLYASLQREMRTQGALAYERAVRAQLEAPTPKQIIDAIAEAANG